ncbi:MAG: ester cyclase [Coleofasciculus sp. Co-bin14]|nr:ester cyclase [Coleofasciculus sp. Co-bin14]
MFGVFKDIYRVLNTDVGDLLFHKDKEFHKNTDSPGIVNQYSGNSPEAKKAIAQRYYQEIMNEANLAVIDELMSPDFLFTIPTHPEPYRGPDGFKNLVTMLHGAFPDVHLKVEHLLVDGDTVVGHWIGSGTHIGGALHTVKGDIPPSGKHFVIDGVSWLKIVNGKVVESLANEDTLSLLQQIGVIPAPAHEAHKAIARSYFNDVINAGNLELIGEIIAPEFVMHLPLLPHPVRGQEGLKHFVTMLRTAFPDIRYAIEREMGDQEMAAIRWTMAATHQGEFLGTPARGNSVHLQGVNIFRVHEGQIVEIWVNENDLGLLEQIGRIPAAQ